MIQCSTKRNNLINRTYHNITAHYNAYFYGNESLKEGVTKLENLHEDNYDDVLQVFKYGTDTKAKNIYPEMDIAIEKASKVIQRHEINAKPKNKTNKKRNKKPGKKREKKKEKKTGDDYKNWIDDSYLMIGQAHFYKHDFYKAIITFEFIAKQYKKNSIKYEALVWMIKSNNQLGNFNESQTILDILYDKKNKKKIPKKIMADLSATHADFYIRQKKYPSAIIPLKKAIELTRKKQIRTRYTFILAQLYQLQGDYNKASGYFEDVLNMRPSYEMAFQARISMAKGLSARNSKEIKQQLEKMLREEENAEYYDQIYYTLAIIAQKEGDFNSTIKYLKLSVSSSVSNTHQKGLSFLKLADIFFEQPSYPLARAYYDSAATFLSDDYHDYSRIVNKKNSLTDIVRNLNIIAYEDSLQQLAAMSQKELDKIIRGIIAKIIEDEQEEREEDSQAKYRSMYGQDNTRDNNRNVGSQWYFYNPTAISFGFSEFLRKWGDRELEDNWRRKNKKSFITEIADTSSGTDDEDISGIGKVTGDLKDKNTYLKNIPLTKKQMEESHSRIIEAYFNLGIIYKELLLDEKQSAKVFEELLERYPENKYRLSTCYHLYRLYLSTGDQNRSEYYKNIILTDYPDSDYSKIINNPDYIKEMEDEKNKIERYYRETYQGYTNNQYELVLRRCNSADSLFPDNALMPKFDYLKALSTGKTKDIPAFETALKEVVKKYPDDEVKTQAQEILDYISKLKRPKTDTMSDILKDTIPAGFFTFNKNAAHYYILVVPDTSVDIIQLKTSVSDYNSNFFRMGRLDIDNMFLDAENQLIVVKKFKNMIKGIDYYDAIRENKTVLSAINPDNYQQFIISADNFLIFYDQKNIDDYLAFFKQNYKNN
ncbi:MAG: tetratricopeptide repeat protein [Bacteroidota bacterium]